MESLNEQSETCVEDSVTQEIKQNASDDKGDIILKGPCAEEQGITIPEQSSSPNKGQKLKKKKLKKTVVHTSTQTSEQERENRFFKDFVIDVASLEKECTILDVTELDTIDQDIDDWPTLLVQQLSCRDTLVRRLENQLEELLQKGRRLEEDYEYLRFKIWSLEEQERSTKFRRKNRSSQTFDEDFQAAWTNWYANSDPQQNNFSFYNHAVTTNSLITSSCTDTQKDGSDSGTTTAVSHQAGVSEKARTDTVEKGSSTVPGWEDSESIVDQVKKVAEEMVQGSGYVYEEQSGFYYDYSSGYYYDAERGLYYDGQSGTYFYYDHETQAYQFHSQVPVQKDSVKKRKKEKRIKRDKPKRPKEVKEEEEEEEKEEGECTDSSNEEEDESEEEEEEENDEMMKEVADQLQENEESSAPVPPSLRLMVTDSKSERVTVGTLYIVTLSGGTIGRESNNVVQLSAKYVSKTHAEISYTSSGPEDHHFYIKDLGSNNGTFVNDTRLSEPKITSEPVEIGHGSKIKCGPVVLQCHVHPGNLTCNECEPGIVLAALGKHVTTQGKSYSVGENKEKTRKKQLKAMRKKYALTWTEEKPSLNAEYEDKAEKRRKEKGSDNPYEKTEVGSVDVALTSKNKGFKLLQKMGWSEGEGLGKSQHGITEPVQHKGLVAREGLGAPTAHPPTGNGLPSRSSMSQQVLNITKKRYQDLG